MRYVLIESFEQDLILLDFLKSYNLYFDNALKLAKLLIDYNFSSKKSDITNSFLNSFGSSSSSFKDFSKATENIKPEDIFSLVNNTPLGSNQKESKSFSFSKSIHEILLNSFDYQYRIPILALPNNILVLIEFFISKITSLKSIINESKKEDIKKTLNEESNSEKERLTNEIKNKLDIILNNTYFSDYRVLLMAPLLSEPKLSTKSSYTEPTNLLGAAGSFASEMTQYFTAITGSYPVISNLLKVPIWSNSEPISFNLELLFHSKGKAFEQVVLPSIYLLSLSTIRAVGVKREKSSGESSTDYYYRFRYKVPGVNLGTLGEALNSMPQSTDNNTSATDKPDPTKSMPRGSHGMFNIYIPGLFKNMGVLIESVDVTFSRNVDEDFNPIWAKVSLDCRTIFSGTSFDIQKIYLEKLRSIATNSDLLKDFTKGTNVEDKPK